jgi:hypothetical protein
VIVPKSEDNLSAIWLYVSSTQYVQAVKAIDRSLKVPTLTLLKVPFDVAYWQKVADEKYPNGLPEPYSDDPMQWLFHGHPRYAEAGTELQVALARLAGYRWPAESDAEMRLSAEARAHIAKAESLPEADADGLLPLEAVLGERPLASRLRAYCAVCWGDDWRPDSEAELIAAACDRFNDRPLQQPTFEAWLRGPAARQHAKLFHDRPFLWWITDGRSDGFTVVAHYHRLDRASLERLAYSMLNDWIARLGDDPRADYGRILQQKLALILEGEALRHFCALEAIGTPAARLGPRSRRRRALEYPPVCRGQGAGPCAERQIRRRPRQRCAVGALASPLQGRAPE